MHTVKYNKIKSKKYFRWCKYAHMHGGVQMVVKENFPICLQRHLDLGYSMGVEQYIL